MIFISVGSRSFQFDRLLESVDKAIKDGKITDTVFAQIGASKYKVENFKTIDFLNQEDFLKYLQECDIVLTHGGSGVIINAVKLGKRVIAVPRLSKYGEAVDDHQLQLVQAFEKKGMVIGCYDCSFIAEAINESMLKTPITYKTNTHIILNSIDEYIKDN